MSFGVITMMMMMVVVSDGQEIRGLCISMGLSSIQQVTLMISSLCNEQDHFGDDDE